MCPADYASHSFRIGAATTAAAAVGLSSHLIKPLGRWNGNAYMSYVRCPECVIASTSQQLSTASVPPGIWMYTSAYTKHFTRAPLVIYVIQCRYKYMYNDQFILNKMCPLTDNFMYISFDTDNAQHEQHTNRFARQCGIQCTFAYILHNG